MTPSGLAPALPSALRRLAAPASLKRIALLAFATVGISTSMTSMSSVALGRTNVTFAGAGTLDAPMAAEIAATKRRLDVMAPDAEQGGMTNLTRTLSSLARRGVQVRLLLTARQPGVKNGQCAPCDALAADGVYVRYVANEGDAFFAVIDGPRKKRATGDASRLVLINGGLGARGDAAMLTFVREGDYVLAFQDEFQHLWSKSYDYAGPGTAPRRPTLAVKVPAAPAAPWAWFSSANMTPVKASRGWLFTPTLDLPAGETGVISSFVAGAIDHAYASVDVTAKDLRRATIYAALRQALTRGVRVRILVEQKDYVADDKSDCKSYRDGDAGFASCLARLGASVAYAPTAKGGVRANYLVIDDKLALTGNFGWSAPAEFKSFGNLVALHGGAVAHYATLFDLRFASALRPKAKRGHAAAPSSAAMLTAAPKDGTLCRQATLTASALEGMPELKDYWQAGGCR